MATIAQQRELEQKLARLITDQFHGDIHAIFNHYAAKGRLSKPELMALLKDATIGNWLTRGAWADGILHELDRDKDGAITQADLEPLARSQNR
jgi:hypothetical protein